MKQKNLFGTEIFQTYSLAGNAELVHAKAWLSKVSADDYLEKFTEQLLWEQPKIQVYGKTYRIPRLQAWYGDEQAVMVYSGAKFYPNKWHPKLRSLRIELEKQCAVPFNSVLANLYRDECDGMGWHSDNEPELGEAPVIASVSLGESRNLRLRLKKTRAARQLRLGLAEDKLKLNLEHGDLLVMRGDMQSYWEHAVPKSSKPMAPRINLTFRLIRSPA